MNDIEKKVLLFQENGDENLRNEIILSKASLVNAILKPFKTSPLFEDLRQDGYLGVIKAINKFKKGGSFGQCVFQYVKNEIYKNYFIYSSPVKVNLGAINRCLNLRKKKNQLSVILEREPLNYELADFAGIRESKIDYTLNLTYPASNEIFEKARFNETNENFSDFHYATNENNIEEISEISAKLSNLSEIEKTVIEKRFGLSGPKHTLDDLSKLIGKTKERVRQIQNAALKKLKKKLSFDII